MYTGTLQTFFFIFTYRYTGNVEILCKDVVSLFPYTQILQEVGQIRKQQYSRFRAKVFQISLKKPQTTTTQPKKKPQKPQNLGNQAM